jgi:hypothetical protein
MPDRQCYCLQNPPELLGEVACMDQRKEVPQDQGRLAAYRTLYTYLFGKTMTASMQDKILKNLQSFKFDAECSGFTFKTYVNKHVEQHNLHHELTEHGVDDLSEHMKILYFKNGITDPRFASVHSAILVDRKRYLTFDKVRDVYLTHSRAIATANDAAVARDRRSVSSVNGRGRGRQQDRGRGSRSDNRGGRGSGKSHQDGIPSQVEIDRCTHIEAKHYPWTEYKKFSASEKQRLFQLTHKDLTPGTGPCCDCRGGGRSVALTMTDGSSSNPKRSASSAKMDMSDDDKSLFPDSDADWDASDDRRKSNQANTHQSL